MAEAGYHVVVWQCPRTQELSMVRFHAESVEDARVQATRCLPEDVEEVFIVRGDRPVRFKPLRGPCLRLVK